MLATEMFGLNNLKHRSLDNYNCQDSFLMLPCWQPRTSLPPVHCPAAAAAKLIMLWIQNKTVWLLRVSTQLSLQRPGAHTHLARVRTGASDAGVRKLGLIYLNLQLEKPTRVLNDKIVASRLCPVGQQLQEFWIAAVGCVVLSNSCGWFPSNIKYSSHICQAQHWSWHWNKSVMSAACTHNHTTHFRNVKSYFTHFMVPTIGVIR